MFKDLVDLDNCAREPIHIPGSIQPHGVLLVLKDPGLEVVQVSENCESMLGISADRVLKDGLASILDTERLERIRFALASSEPRDQNPVELGLPCMVADATLNGIVHHHEGFHFLELEFSAPYRNSQFLDFYKNVSKVTDRLQSAPDVKALASEAAEGIRRVTEFDRVMVYRFAAGGEGEVIAEAKAEELESFYGLWYPASDIPEQARRLYLLSPIRCIPSVSYEPVPLIPTLNPVTRAPTDLSFASLRSVSSIHCEYLTNMGVAGSMSVSILCGGKLWGLIACHHNSRKVVAYETRRACTFLGQVLSGEIVRRESEQESAYIVRSTETLASFLGLMAGAHTPVLGLTQGSPGLLDLIPASGAAVVSEGKIWSFGAAPGFEEILELTRMLQEMRSPGVFVTNSLRYHFPQMESTRATAAGLIALEISRESSTFILFFRPEVAQTVTWGGNPTKPVVIADNSARLGPRKSFEKWKEEVRGSSLPWTEGEIGAASELRKLVLLARGKGNGTGR